MIEPLAKLLHRLEDGALIAALLTMLGLAVMQIILRDFFDIGLLWAESFLRILVLWVTMLGAMVATRMGNHISIDVVSRYLPARPARWAAVLAGGVSAAICGAVAWYAVVFIQFEYEDHTIAFADVPNWICETILPVGFAVMALRFLFAAARRLVGRETG